MKRILLSVMVALGVAGIVLTVQQKNELSSQIDQRKKLTAKIGIQEGVLTETEEECANEQKNVAQWNTSRGEKASLVANERDKADGLISQREDLQTQYAAKQGSYQKMLDELDKYDFKDPQDVIDRNDAASKKNKELLASIEEEELLLQAESKKNAGVESQLASLQKRQAEWKKKAIANAKQFQISAVEPQWGFVVVNAGSDSNITPETVLLVSRGGKSVAKLKVSSLEKRQTVADVVEGSLSVGNRVEVGDTVYLLKPQG